ncbi:LPS-assembly protein LptD [Comamonas sp. NoAH]|uniref:LPS-assembly protein LptD n=1 Tax=Comamonas halotolerans TaxID=3041496 RepID=UPI0024E06D9A|nr:LPS-assembly protein LptD [Comamonas sp. NoAH]
MPQQISSYRLRPLAASLAMAWAATAAWSVQAQDNGHSLWDSALPAPQLKSSPQLQESLDSSVREQLPSYIKAEQITGQADINTVLEGGAELRRGDTVIRADRVEYSIADDTVDAQGNVHINRGGNVYQGTSLKLQVDAFQGDFTDATYQFLETQGHGDAQRVEFIDRDNSVVHQATYTTCLRDDSASWEPDWMIRAKRITLDRVEDVGVAYDGALEFKGVPILPIPAISFPLSDKRKSGLLPPTIGIDSVSGVEYSQPYYWNIAPNRDATITPTIMSKRGVSLGTEFRYLEPNYSGVLDLLYMPDDRLRDRDRWGYNWRHATSLSSPIGNLGLNWNLKRVSDNNYWRDFNRMPGEGSNFGSEDQRLLSSDGTLSWSSGRHSLSLYAQKWQVLQDVDDPIAPPFNRMPQLRWNYDTTEWATKGWDVNLMAETTRFEADTWDGGKHPDNGQRSYALTQISHPFLLPGGFITPKVQMHASNYQFDDASSTRPRSKSFAIPTLSLDSGLVFERDTALFGNSYVQTLEPRAFYTYTPYRDQSMVPLYDTALTDFNFGSIYSENSYTGRDRIADNNMLTLGVTTRYIKPEDGTEVARLGVAQRLRFKDQRVGLGSDILGEKGWSDILVGGGVNWNSRWSTDALVQYNRNINRTVRSSISGRYTPGPYKTLSAAYRYQREDSMPVINPGSEQVDFGWQWPLNAGNKNAFGEATGGGRWYSVGRLNYSMHDKKLVDAIVGFEYDSCCWIGRVVVERMQNSRRDSNTRLLFQIEFVGFSRLSLGADPLRRLQEFVPGYRSLRDSSGTVPSRFSNYD